MKRLILVAALLFAAPARAATDDPTYYGPPAATTCYTYTHNADFGTQVSVANWLAGFWSGINLVQASHQDNQVDFQDATPLVDELQKVCKAHPTKLVVDAAADAWISMAITFGRRGTHAQ
jgi:hypothetical protein